jgi:peptidoglycan/xylan/chitin deacetylase (PgdA/CDA1 family)
MTNATICISYHFDAVSTWLWVYDSWSSPTRHSRGLFGVLDGAPRLLDLHDRYDVPSSWCIPGHTVESFPQICGEVHDQGHDVEHHGWTHHRFAGDDDYEAERDDFVRGIEAIEDLTGRTPTGYSSTAWEFSEHTLNILLELGFEWDSSIMAREFRPHYVYRGWSAPADAPYDRGKPTDLVELPVSWERDDWPPFTFTWSNPHMMAYIGEDLIFQKWRNQFDWMREHIDDGVYLLTLHPQVVGQSNRIHRLEALFQYMQSKPGVEFKTLETVAREFKTGRYRGEQS